MSLFYKILGSLAGGSLVAIMVLLRKRIKGLIQRQRIRRLRKKADRLITGKVKVSEEKNEDIVNKFLQLYETSVSIQNEDRTRIQELNAQKKRTTSKSDSTNSQVARLR